MIALTARPERTKIVARASRFRIDAPVTHPEVYPESLFLRRWASRQAAGYQSLLQSIAAAGQPARDD